MALVGEPGGQSDLAKRIPGIGKLLGREIESEPANVIADCGAEVPAKKRGEVNRMHIDQVRDFIMCQVFIETIMKKIARLLQPARRLCFSGIFEARELGENL